MQVCAINQRIPFNNKDKKLQKAIFKKQLKNIHTTFFDSSNTSSLGLTSQLMRESNSLFLK